MRYQKDDNGCWNFTGQLNHWGYGKVILKQKTYAAHRLIAHITIKALMSDKEIVAHRCDNPRCINPEHLFITTGKGNSLDMVAKGRASRGERHPNSKLTGEDVRLIRIAYSEGSSISKIQKSFPNVTFGCIQAVIERRTWKHIV